MRGRKKEGNVAMTKSPKKRKMKKSSRLVDAAETIGKLEEWNRLSH